jgi:ADP-heptose:LPS heptosyltransferase
VTRIITTKSGEVEDIGAYLAGLKKKLGIDRVIDLCESIEVDLSLHPRSPRYNYSKKERFELCNVNFYEHTLKKAGVDISTLTLDQFRPELFFSESEEKQAKGYFKPDKFNILIGMSGSGRNKAYPWTEILCGSILNEMKAHVHIITVGDEVCQIIEPIEPKYITNLSGKTSMRISCCMTQFADLVISPDTGLLHASGCYPTPKIGIIGHNTVENITKYFLNDHSFSADPELAPCAPCFRMIYDQKLQCVIDEETGGSLCMSKGLKPELVFDKVKLVYAESQNRS